MVDEKEIEMIVTFTGSYRVHVSDRSFEQIVSAIEAATGTVENEVFDRELQEATTPDDFERRMRSHESKSGFMRFHTIDHGAWLAALGSSGKTKMYTIGNPLIARTMIKYDLGVGLNVPVRIAVYEDATTGKACVAYTLPSSLMSALDNQQVSEAAKGLDAKLVALAEAVSVTAA